MGRHSRKGPAPKGADADPAAGTPDERRAADTGQHRVPGGVSREQRLGQAAPSGGHGGGAYGSTAHGAHQEGAQGPTAYDGNSYDGNSYGGTAQGRTAYDGGYYGGDGEWSGYPAPAHVPGAGHPAPAHVPGGEHLATGSGQAHTRGGHPEQHEAGGGWGDPAAPHAPGADPRASVAAPRIPGPRAEFVDAFDEPRAAAPADPRAPGAAPADDPSGTGTGTGTGDGRDGPRGGGLPGGGLPGQRARGGWGRTATGIAAAAVTTVLAVVVAGQVAEDGGAKPGASTTGQDRPDEDESASRSDTRSAPKPAGQKAQKAQQPPTYAELMAARFPIDPKMAADGTFEAVPGLDRAPGTGEMIRYRVDVEKGLGLDGVLFAQAVQRTLNDDRSWAHGGAMTFERISSGKPKFVVTLASPETTHEWCDRSTLDTSVENVSCDAALSERVMINGFRWAQGSETYGPEKMHAYRQMLINHEVGHRLGHTHVKCAKEGALAPVMQQQTKSLNIGGIECRPNSWPYPGN
ncbi:DUF3152 domain-containing protein [Streptomyces katsurahamanus]|uniref:DUF3152 domain-containing protein n=1 Tax=Streptomyces katsurahamanus TaxID=2577098 RepID=A0ABW9NQM3_9ACTN|nr:DUF3152 domain-containing protein [Streptomyces katsurahamanus]MQS35566.1 DUF3152 domain-containing protein [Streptomyces katsurahamanus]